MVIGDIHQLSQTTGYNRYPKIFYVCKKYFIDNYPSKQLHILSFGCSTGEECFTLSEYFQSSTILGVDINKYVIDTCIKKNTHNNIYFSYSNYENISDKSPYDIIFCMSVFCRLDTIDGVQNIGHIYPFSKFNSTIEELDTFLNIGGILVIYNSNFRFSDTFIYNRYKVYNDKEIKESGFVLKFDKYNNKINSQYNEVIFTKLEYV